uniref:Uncharacterized protein n=1 Tax=Aegilops tauschii subsp. strangulata TaxID=200361 RepID=A0A453GEV0_AEGTS
MGFSLLSSLANGSSSLSMAMIDTVYSCPITILLDPMKRPKPQIAPPEPKFTILSSLGTLQNSLARKKTKNINKEHR